AALRPLSIYSFRAACFAQCFGTTLVCASDNDQRIVRRICRAFLPDYRLGMRLIRCIRHDKTLPRHRLFGLGNIAGIFVCAAVNAVSRFGINIRPQQSGRRPTGSPSVAPYIRHLVYRLSAAGNPLDAGAISTSFV
ncbi:hypothetical protein, partial [Methylomonas fluvii]